MKTSETQPGTRERLILAMLDRLQRQGFHGVGIQEVYRAANVSKGALYHYFPGGKTDLAIAAVQHALSFVQEQFSKFAKEKNDPASILEAWFTKTQRQLVKSGFERGCPLATIALETTSQDDRLRGALNQAFEQLRETICEMLIKANMNHARARQLTMLIVSYYEGSLMQARVSERIDPIEETQSILISLIRSELASVKND